MSGQRVSVGLLIAFLSVFIDLLAVTIILPIVPFLAIDFGASSTEIGFIYAAYAGAQMISVPISGRLSDVYGRRPMILMSLLGSTIGFLAQGLAWNTNSLIVARALAGVFGGSIPICMAYIADTIPQVDRPRHFAMLGSVITVAFLFGPGIGAGLSQFTLQTPMFVSAALSAMGLTVAVFKFKEPVRLFQETPSTEKEASVSPLTKTANPYKWSIWFTWLTSFTFMLGFSSYIYFFGLRMYDVYDWGTLEVGFSTMAVGILGVLIQLTLYPKVQGRLGKHGSGILGVSLSGIGLLLFSTVSAPMSGVFGAPMLCLSLILLVCGHSFGNPSITGTLSRYASSGNQGSILGVSESLQAAARTAGPLIWGAIYDSSPRLVFILAGFSGLIGALSLSNTLRLNLKLPEHAKPTALELLKIDTSRSDIQEDSLEYEIDADVVESILHTQ